MAEPGEPENALAGADEFEEVGESAEAGGAPVEEIGVVDEEPEREEVGKPEETPRRLVEEGDRKPEEEQEMRLSEFGRHSTDVFRPSEPLRKAFKDNLEIIAAQLSQYQEDSPGAMLTKAQRDFLRVYNEVGGDLLKTSDGWVLANLMSEEAMFLRLAALQKEVNLYIKRRTSFKESTDSLVVQGEEAKRLRGMLNRLKGSIEGTRFLYIGTNILGLPDVGIDRHNLAEILKGEVVKPGIELKLQDLQIVDISTLPPEYRNFLNYLSPGVEPEEVKKFIIHAGKARQEFYEALGVPPGEQRRAAPWQGIRALEGRSDVGPRDIVAATEDLGVNWVRFRNSVLKRKLAERLTAGQDFADPGEPALLSFEAQQETIENFLRKYLVKTASARAEKTITIEEEGGRREKLTSVAAMETRIKTLENPRGVEERRREARQKIQDLEGQTTGIDNKLNNEEDGIIATIDKKEVEKEALENKLANLERDRAGAQDNIDRLERDKEDLRNQKIQTESDYNTQITNAPNERVQAALLQQKNERLTDLNKRIGAIEAKITKAQEEKKGFQQQIDRIGDLEQEIEVLNRKKARLEAKLGELNVELEDQKQLIEVGVEEKVQEKVDKLKAAVSVLKRFDEVESAVTFPPEKEFYTVDELTSLSVKHEYGADYHEGYWRILELLFKFDKTAERNRNFKTATAVLSPYELALVLNESLDLGITVDRDEHIRDVFQAIRTQRISQARLGETFLSVLGFVEMKGLLIE